MGSLTHGKCPFDQSTTYEEQCKRCRGSGEFRTWSGALVGRCLRCNGTGVLQFRTSPEARAARKAAAERAEENRLQSVARAIEAWKESHPAETAFLIKKKSHVAFHQDLWCKLHLQGHLTPKQLSAIRQGIEQEKRRPKPL